MKKIAIFQSELRVGGIQKSLVNLLNSIDYDRFQVDLYLSHTDKFWNVRFPEKLNIYYLKPTPRIFSFLPFDFSKRMIDYGFSENLVYDLAIDFNSYQCSCAVGALSIPAKRRVMWIHNDVQIKYQNEWKYRVLWFFFKDKFKYYDEFVPVSSALIQPFVEMTGEKNKKFTVIENLINVSEIREKMLIEPDDLALDKSCFNFVALGRLCHQKGYDIMLDEFDKACRQRSDLRLYIIGDGPDEAELKKYSKEKGLDGKVFFLGRKENPYCYMYRMDAFVSCSRYEGQPLNIMEAMAIGLPLYCTKNLEIYIEGLKGVENLSYALISAEKEDKHEDDLVSYNNKILNEFAKLANFAE